MTSPHPSAGTPEAGPLAGLHVLVVDDEADIRLGLRRLLTPLGVAVDEAEGGPQALERLDASCADVVLTDLKMPAMSGGELLLEIKRRRLGVEVVVMTGFGTVETAVECLRNGAAHFLTKPFDNREIVDVLTRLGRQVLARRSLTAPGHGANGPRFIARDPSMRNVLELIERAAPRPVTLLIQGESGTGKELVAREVHARSHLAERPFLAVNAAALPDTLLEAELFGHEKGAFTGADGKRPGLFVEARGGTIFLDEVGSMSLAFQAKLLRVLQERVVRPLGSARDVPVDFRLLAATNRDLAELVREGAFREDLLYRLRVVTIHLPPLRERKSDIETLALHFLERAATTCLGPDASPPKLSAEALEALREHPWPGNVRELENTMQRAVIVCYGPRLLPHHLGLTQRAWGGDGGGGDVEYESAKRLAIERFQREFIQRALERSAGNVSRAAEACSLTRAAFQRIMRQLDIDRDPFRAGAE